MRSRIEHSPWPEQSISASERGAARLGALVDFWDYSQNKDKLTYISL